MFLFFILLISVTPVKDFKYARGLFNDGFYDLAETELTGFLNKYPEHQYSAEVSVMLLKSLNAQGSYDKTVIRAKHLIKKYPSRNNEILEQWTEALTNLGRYDEALSTARRISDESSRELWIGEIFFNQNNFEDALEYYKKSNAPYSKLSAGWCYMKLKKYNEASEIFSGIEGKYREEAGYLHAKSLYLSENRNAENAFLSYLDKYPEGKYSGRCYYHLSEIAEEEGDIEQAIKYIEKVPSVDPGLSGFANYRAGILFYKSNKYEKAIDKLKEVDKENEYYWDALYWTGLSQIKMGDTGIAKKILKKVSEGSEELKNRSLYELASLHRKTGDNSTAKKIFSEISGELKDEALIALGNIYLEEKNYEKAFNIFTSASDLNQGNTGLAMLQAGIALKKSGKLEEAINHLDKIQKSEENLPYYGKSQLLKGDIYLEMKEFRSALDLYNSIDTVKYRHLRPYLLEGKSWAWMGLERYDMAFLMLEELSEKFPDFCSRPQIYLQMGNAAYAMDKFDVAENAYRQVGGDLRPEALFLLGKMLFETREYNRAIEVFQKIKNEYSLSEYAARGMYYSALSLRKKHDLRASNKLLYTSISENIDENIVLKSYLLLGDNYFDIAKYDSSLKYYRKSFDFAEERFQTGEIPDEEISAIRGILVSVNSLSGPSEMEATARDLIRKVQREGIKNRINLLTGNLLFNSGNYNRAIDYLEDSNSPESFYQAGIAYLKLNRRDQAIIFLKKALESKKTADRAYLELGRIEIERNNLERAKNYLSRSNLPESSLLLARIMKDEGRENEAISKLRGLTGKVGGLAYLELAKIQIDRGMDDPALKNLEKGLDYERAAPECYYLTGKIMSERKEYEDSKKSLLKVKYLYPESEWVSPSLFLLAEITISQGDTSRAKSYLKEIINRGEEKWVQKAEEKLSELD